MASPRAISRTWASCWTKAPGEAIRLALLAAHYRDPLDWTRPTGLRQARGKPSIASIVALLTVGGMIDTEGSRAAAKDPCRRSRGRPEHRALTIAITTPSRRDS